MKPRKFNGFHFKQFSIAHGNCAMKVGTDSIMLGSWAIATSATNILDIGSGSGLLAIMLAQKTSPHCRITGIDIEPSAVQQARDNAAVSPWPHKLSFYHQDVSAFTTESNFDLIISNPPYFAPPAADTNAYNKMGEHRQSARRTDAMGFKQLVTNVTRLLTVEGCFYCVLPVSEADELIECAIGQGLMVQRRMLVFAAPLQAPIRQLLCLARTAATETTEQLTIHAEDGGYSRAYKELCKEYYLNF